MAPYTLYSGSCPTLIGKYANHFAIGFNQYEFVLDFGQSYSENDPAEPCLRVITTPAYAKAFVKALSESITHYEEEFGNIGGPSPDIAK